MNPELQVLITDIESLLKSQTHSQPDSAKWYALGNLEAFVSAIKIDFSERAVAKASWALGQRLSDQSDWPEEEVKVINQFLKRIRRIGKTLKNC